MPDNNNAIRRHIDASSKELELFILKLEKILKGKARRLLSELLSQDKFASAKALDNLNIIAQLDQVLADSQVQDQLGELRQLYGKELHAIRDLYFAGTQTERFYSGIDADIVETLIKYDTEAVTTNLVKYVDDVRSTLTRAVITGESPNFEDVHDANFSAGQLQTELQTLYSGFSRAVIAKKAKDVGFDKYEYIGPDDKVTRPFCHKVLNQRDPPIYTEAEINDMDNGQTGDVMTNCGGYNCRHQWRPVE